MSASNVTEGQTIVGDLIDIEVCEDVSATDPTWNKVAKTKDTVELAPNTEIANVREHGQFAQDKDATSEAWEISFSSQVVTGPGQLQTLGLLTDNFAEKGHNAVPGDSGEALRITIYEDAAAKAAGEMKYQVGTDDYILAHDGGELSVEDYSTLSLVIHSRVRPIHLGLGGEFDQSSGGGGGA